jgi:hypothetical protein
MKFTKDQRGVIVASVIAILVTAGALLAAYRWLPPHWVGVDRGMGLAERLAYALQWNLAMLLWLAGCVRAVSSGRFRSEADIRGSAYAPPSPAIAVQAAVLQNSLEQTVLAFGANLVLATVLRDDELVLLPVLVGLFLIGRVSFAWAYPKGAAARAFGMALTGAALIASLGIAAVLIVLGR